MAGPSAYAFESFEFRAPGADAALLADLRSASLLVAAQSEKVSDPQDLFAAALAEYGRLVGALYAAGHYSPVVRVLVDGREAAGIPPLDAPKTIRQIIVEVQPGPAFAFSRARVAPLTPDTALPDGFVVGGVARSGLIKDAVAAGVDGWREAGHAKAAPGAQSLTADHRNATLSAEVALTPGPRLRFGPLTVTGQQRMREARVRAIAGLPEGEAFSPRDLARSAERLRRTGVFRSVTLTEDENITRPDLLGITATVVEDKRRRYSFGAELATLDGLSVTGSWLHRNLLGGAERLEIKGNVANIGAQESGEDYALGLTLSRPATFTADTTLGFHVEVAHLDEADYLADVAGIGMTLSHFFTDTLTGTAGLEYSISGVDDLTGDYTYRNLSLPLGAIWDTRDVKLDAHKGIFVEAEVMPFQGFGTTDSGVRMKLDARAYRSFGSERPVVFAGRVQAGAVLGSSLLGTPRDYLFYSGGGGTVRGQPYQSLGVNVLRADFKIGGTAFLGASAEVRAKVTDKIGIVGFVDAGHVGALDFFDDLGGFHAGAGLGVRYDTGFGPIRVDLAGPVAGDTGKGVQLYVGIGQSF
ncbi:autotransporter assembly complex family protein [Paracoccaceae bacterium Fryx2]|nr:autotransporter assembly complex family protein [Paracoccaceae bacterium Fryx2]